MKEKVLLGSASLRRHEVFRSLGIEFEVVCSDVEEVLDAGDPVWTVKENARRKFEALRVGREDRWMVTADTVVFAGGRCLGKPRDVEEGVRMLCSYSGGVQWVVTGMVFAEPFGEGEGRECVSSIRFREISEVVARAYLREYGTVDRAGAYDVASFGEYVLRVDGSWTNVRGIPEEVVGDWFRGRGYFGRLGNGAGC